MVRESERDGRKEAKRDTETEKENEGDGGSSIAASITSGERADSSEAICLSFRANLLRPASSLSLFPLALFLPRSEAPLRPRARARASPVCPSAPLRLSSAILDSAPFSHAPPN